MRFLTHTHLFRLRPFPPVFLGLLLTDLSYLAGAAVFVALAFQQGVHLLTPPGTLPWVRLSTPLLPPPPGVIKWLQFVWVVGFLLPLAAILVCTPFGTGPMAAAVLIPYFVLLLAEYAAETWPKMVLSPVWPIIAILFQVRLCTLSSEPVLQHSVLSVPHGSLSTHW